MEAMILMPLSRIHNISQDQLYLPIMPAPKIVLSPLKLKNSNSTINILQEYNQKKRYHKKMFISCLEKHKSVQLPSIYSKIPAKHMHIRSNLPNKLQSLTETSKIEDELIKNITFYKQQIIQKVNEYNTTMLNKKDTSTPKHKRMPRA